MIFNLHRPEEVDSVKLSIEAERAKGKTIGVTSGCFDLFHFLHVIYFERCRRYCDILIVGLDSDELVRGIKGEGRPIFSDARRSHIVDALKAVNYVCVMNTVEDLRKISKIFEPDYMFKNDAFIGMDRKDIIGAEYCKELIMLFDLVEHPSTTSIIDQITTQRLQKKLPEKSDVALS